MEKCMIKDIHQECINCYFDEYFFPALKREVCCEAGAAKFISIAHEIHGKLKGAIFPHAPFQVTAHPAVCTTHRLVVGHQCSAIGCMDQACQLCRMNPVRMCAGRILWDTYFIGSCIKARCDQPLMVRLVDINTGSRLRLNGDICLSIVSEGKLSQMYGYHPPNCAQDTRVCEPGEGGESLLFSNDPLVKWTEDGQMYIKMEDGEAHFPEDLTVTQSSRVLLKGINPPNYMILCKFFSDRNISDLQHIECGVSEPFAVATQRAKANAKKRLPTISDNVTSLVHIHTKRRDRLSQLRKTELEESDADGIPTGINTIHDFLIFARAVRQSWVLRSKVLEELRMSSSEWCQTCEHSESAVVPDSLLRSWKLPCPIDGIEQLLFKCYMAEVLFSRGPVGVVGEGHITWSTSWTPELRARVEELSSVAKNQWFIKGHSGWAKHHIDSNDAQVPSTIDFWFRSNAQTSNKRFSLGQPEGVLNRQEREQPCTSADLAKGDFQGWQMDKRLKPSQTTYGEDVSPLAEFFHPGQGEGISSGDCPLQYTYTDWDRRPMSASCILSPQINSETPIREHSKECVHMFQCCKRDCTLGPSSAAPTSELSQSLSCLNSLGKSFKDISRSTSRKMEFCQCDSPASMPSLQSCDTSLSSDPLFLSSEPLDVQKSTEAGIYQMD